MKIILSCRWFVAALLAIGSMLRASAAAPAPSQFQVSGRVISSRDGSPIRNCRVTLRDALEKRRFQQRGAGPADTSSIFAETDQGGHFAIQVPSAGRWQLSATARGFRTQLYDQHEQFSSAVVLTVAQPAMDLSFKLDPDGLLAGTVLDEAGESVRGANVQVIAAGSPGLEPRQGRGRFSSQTDDRGHYEISGLPPANYKLFVQAEPWYAAAVQTRVRPGSGAASSSSTVDSSLDVVYPMTWFPGVDDAAAADVLTIHAGETREADFNLSPVPSIHLLTSASLPASPSTTGVASMTPWVQVARLSLDGLSSVNVRMTAGSDRQLDIDGLAPGLYRLQTRGGPGQPEQITFLRVPGGAQTSVDASSAVEAARVSLQFDGLEDAGRIGVTLIDPSTGTIFRSNVGQGGFRRRPGGDTGAPSSPALQVPEGSYQVVLSPGDQDISIGSLIANGVPVPGRLISVHQGDNLVHISVVAGHASVKGIATLEGKPDQGAMVMLVPASFGDPASIPVLRRDQTNTDGSFELADVLPGQYILAVVDRGWQIDWHSAAALERYLLHGFPLSLGAGDEVHHDVSAQLP